MHTIVHDHFYQQLVMLVCARMQMHTIVHDYFYQQLAMVVCACMQMHAIVHHHFYQQLVMAVCARMHSARYFVHDHFYQQLAKVHVRPYTARACSANVRVCTHTSTHAHTHFYPQRARVILTCEYALPHTQALEAFMYLQCDHAPPPPCLGTTANSLRGVNFEQTQTSRKTISNHSSKPGILKLVDLV